MKNKYIYTIVLGLLLLVNYGCSEEFLETEPTSDLTTKQIQEASENNPEVVAGSLAGIYTTMFETGTGGTDLDHNDFGQKGYDIFSDILSGDIALSKNTYNWYNGVAQLQSTVDFTNNDNYKPWRYYYRIIRASNTVIDALGGNDVVPEIDGNKYLMGQAKALRAYAYFYLTQFFQNKLDLNEKILPIYTNSSQPNQPKSTAQEVYDLIVSDLTSSITLLETFNRSAKNEVNKYVAEGLLAYTYGILGNYPEVKVLTADIINNGGFSIVSRDEASYSFDGDPVGGFDDASNTGWMWGVDLTLDNGLDLVSWWGQMDYFTYSYHSFGDIKVIDKGLYDQIPDTDVRKGQFYNNPDSDYYLSPWNKFYHTDRSFRAQRNITSDYLYMRVAEMYLLNAEACAITGDEPGAIRSLKTLLELRLDDTSYLNGLSGQALVKEVYLQTRIELVSEGKSYLAMKRNKATIVRGSNHLSFVGEPISYDDPRLTFEIPQSEVLNNPVLND